MEGASLFGALFGAYQMFRPCAADGTGGDGKSLIAQRRNLTLDESIGSARIFTSEVGDVDLISHGLPPRSTASSINV
jgi:hypothetical protein